MALRIASSVALDAAAMAVPRGATSLATDALEQLDARDFTAVTGSVHQRYDAGWPPAGTLAASMRAASGAPGSAGRRSYSAAALCMVEILLRFGYPALARQALDEAICVAHGALHGLVVGCAPAAPAAAIAARPVSSAHAYAAEIGDEECLVRALGWLHHLAALAGDGAADALLLDPLVKRAQRQSLYDVLAAAYLDKAKRCLDTGAAADTTMQCVHLAQRATALHSVDAGIVAATHELSAAIWSAYGSASMSNLARQLQMHHATRAADVSAALASEALACYEQSGNYAAARSILAQVAARLVPGAQPAAASWITAALRLVEAQCMRHGYLALARLTHAQLSAALSTQPYADIIFEPLLLGAQRLVALDQPLDATHLLQRASAQSAAYWHTMQVPTKPALWCRKLLAEAHAMCAAGSGGPAGLLGALRPLLRCIALADALHLTSLLAGEVRSAAVRAPASPAGARPCRCTVRSSHGRRQAMLLVAEVELQVLQCPRRARAVVRRYLAHVHANGAPHERGNVRLFHARCDIFEAHRVGASPRLSEAKLRSAMEHLHAAWTQYAGTMAIHRMQTVAYLLARCNHELGQREARNRWARECRRLDALAAERRWSMDIRGVVDHLQPTAPARSATLPLASHNVGHIAVQPALSM